MKDEAPGIRKIAPDVKLGRGVKISDFVNLYGCEIGDNTKIGTFVEIQNGAKIGNNCKISSHTFVCEGVTVEDNVFIGHNVTFTNDVYPRATTKDGRLQTREDWSCIPTFVKRGASIGSGVTLLCGITVGENAIVGAGSVVTKNVAPNTIVAGNPAQVLRRTLDPQGIAVKSIPFIDLKAQNNSIHDEIEVAIQQVLDSSAFAGGPFVEKFEKEYAQFCQCQYAVGVSSGTEALGMALWGFGIGYGDEVITVPNTFIATAEAISRCGAKPVFADIDEQTYNINPALLEAAITSRTKAIIPVHLFGQTADMDPIMEVAKAHRLFVIEDASQAHGAEYKGKPAGSIGDAGCFSFYPSKNLGAYGEAGAIITNNGELAQKVQILRDHGQARKHYHTMIGWNARMDGLQGAILSVKLKYLPIWNEMRRNHAKMYNDLLAEIDNISTPKEADYARHVYHIYAIRTQKRDALISALAAIGIHCGVYYPTPLHLQEAYRSLGLKKGSYPVAEKCAEELLSLPMFPELTEEQIERVVLGIKNNLNTY